MRLSKRSWIAPFEPLFPSDPVPGTKAEQYIDLLRFWFYEDRGLPQVHCIDKQLPTWVKDRYWRHERQPPYTVQVKSGELTRQHRKVLQLRAAGLTYKAVGARTRVCAQRAREVLTEAQARAEQFDPPPAPAEMVVFVQATNTPGELYFHTLGKTFRLVDLVDE